MRARFLNPVLLGLLISTAVAAGAGAATVTIVNLDAAGEGFNDATPVAPVGGNPATTIGAQRLYVFQYAAGIWGGILPSSVEIKVEARFDPMTPCMATSGVLGGAAPNSIHRDFPGAPFAGTWYHQALANRLTGSDLSASNDIRITFNSSVGSPTCLTSGWYYGVDGNEGTRIELLPVVLHELGHGLGFSTSTNGQTGAQSGTPPFPHVYDRFLLDLDQGLHWDQMTAAQRAASGINCARLAWDGPSVVSHSAARLGPRPVLRVTSPGAIAGNYDVGLASFGPPLSAGAVSGAVVLVNDGDVYATNGCEPPLNSLGGRIALVDRGTCTFVAKVKNAQDAGAIAVIVADSVAGCPPAGLGGSDPTITIPSVRITQDDGALIKSQLVSGVNVTLILDPALKAGSDNSGRVFVYTPNPYQAGSSVSHFDVSAEPSLLMEPSITNGLSQDVDLTRNHFQDIGWFTGLTAVGPPARGGAAMLGNAPNPFGPMTSIRYRLESDAEVAIGIYDLAGRLVTRISQGRVPAGTHSVMWDGRDGSGRHVAPGVYRCRLTGVAGAGTISMVRVD